MNIYLGVNITMAIKPPAWQAQQPSPLRPPRSALNRESSTHASGSGGSALSLIDFLKSMPLFHNTHLKGM
jgi:hypothetical protein